MNLLIHQFKNYGSISREAEFAIHKRTNPFYKKDEHILKTGQRAASFFCWNWSELIF